ncbi:MAG TPA: hypothetical protein VNL14_18565 [Candidatus Acidoferrales bacterium]|nr:hypothetical protein [Candidatus Acidoferrales bacterium]
MLCRAWGFPEVSRYRAFLAAVVSGLFTVVSWQALFSIPKLAFELAGAGQLPSALGGLAGAAGAAWILKRYRLELGACFRLAARRLSAIPSRTWLWGCILAGVALRLAWVAAFPAPQRSDSEVYFNIAARLAAGEPYRDGRGEYAYWPPGLPLFLYANFFLFGVKPWVPALANLFLFGVCALAVHRLAELIAGGPAARLAVFLLAAWPNSIALTGLASKEMIAAALLPLGFLLYSSGKETGGAALVGFFASGLCFGYSSLSQPTMVLVPLLLLAYEFLARPQLKISAVRLAIAGIGMAAVVLPWTIRNCAVLQRCVLISTNGGDVFYRANNPLATGGYVAAGAYPLAGLNEIERGEIGFRLGREWIRDHPGGFLRLAWAKQVLFLGDDSKGVYETLKRGLEIGGAAYVFAKTAANLYWYAIWFLVCAALWIYRDIGPVKAPESLFFMLCFIYLFLVHSVFESGGRHHEPLVGFIAIMAATVASGKPESLAAAERAGV